MYTFGHPLHLIFYPTPSSHTQYFFCHFPPFVLSSSFNLVFLFWKQWCLPSLVYFYSFSLTSHTCNFIPSFYFGIQCFLFFLIFSPVSFCFFPSITIASLILPCPWPYLSTYAFLFPYSGLGHPLSFHLRHSSCFRRCPHYIPSGANFSYLPVSLHLSYSHI